MINARQQMQSKSLLEILESAIEEAKAKSKHETSSNLPDDVVESLRIHELCGPVVKCLSDQPEFRDGTCYMINNQNGYCGFQPESLAPILIKKALAVNSPEAAVSWLQKIFSTQSAPAFLVMVLWGISVKDTIKLTEDISLMPIQLLPESRQKQDLVNSNEFTQRLPWESGSLLGKPQVALTVKSTVQPFIFKFKDGVLPEQKEPLKEYYVLDDVRLALTCIGSCTPMQAMHWHHFEDPELDEAKLGMSLGTQHIEIKPMHFNSVSEINAELAPTIVKSYLTMAEKTKKRVRIALERLNQAMRRMQPGDKAMELSIALETLLADGGSENTYKIGVRSALVIGGSAERRLRVRAIIGGAYVMRSKIVHSGEVSGETKVQKIGSMDSIKLANEATEICAEVIRKIIQLGRIPEWFSLEINADR